ncbi:CBS domain-containing protein [bacterium]|nr:CBS domain-containing protein [bacterium]MCI0604234.1 CBS domain-containing protein [bacterium]
MREQEIQTKRIRHLPLDQATYIESGTLLTEVVDLMRKEHASCVLICKEKRCIGIFTERDYLTKVLSTAADRKRPVDEFMSSPVKTLSPDDTVGQAISIMNQFGFRNVPLVDAKGKCTGLLQIRNIIQFLAELYPEEILNVQLRREPFEQTDGA